MSYYPRIHGVICAHFNIINPHFSSAEVGDVDPSTIRMVLDASVTSTSTVALSDFALDFTGGAVTVTSLDADGVNVDLGLSRAIVFGEEGSVAFTPTTTKINILGSGYLRAFTAQTVTNNVGETITDIDGNIYDVITIGTQQWLGQNLKTTKYKDGTSVAYIPEDAAWHADIGGAYCWYDGDIGNKEVYGALYNWYATDNIHGLAPNGWHIPTRDEFITLSTYLGGDAVAGGKLKETGTTHWNSPNTGATNETGMLAVGSGNRGLGGLFEFKHQISSWWTITPSTPPIYYALELSYALTRFINESRIALRGLSIRCIRD